MESWALEKRLKVRWTCPWGGPAPGFTETGPSTSQSPADPLVFVFGRARLVLPV